MTIIVASLFLPYTVHFEVDSQTDANETSDIAVPVKNSEDSKLIISAPIANPGLAIQSSILPSLSSQQSTPLSSSPRTNESIIGSRVFNDGSAESKSADDFFYNHKARRISHDYTNHQLTDSLNEKLGPQYIRPRSTATNNLSISVVEPKRVDDDAGLPAFKVNRSSTNLTQGTRTQSTSNISPLNSSSSQSKTRSRSFLSKQVYFTLNDNDSATSLTITEEDPDDAATKSDILALDGTINESFNDLLHGKVETKMAPFGGFSNPEIEVNICNQDNIFETAKWNVVPSTYGNGSLVKAVNLAAEEGIIKKPKWVGTLAMPSDSVPGHVIDEISMKLQDEFNSEVVVPDDFTFEGHYKSFCKQILWPTLHYQIPDDPKSKAFEDHSWRYYQALNQMVADKIVDVYNKENGGSDPHDPENMIWIHDYHLFLVPKMIRAKIPNAKIGLFLHVSFPSSEVFRCFAQRNALLEGMLGADCISFQTNEYVRHFLQTCNRLLLADVNDFGIAYKNRITTLNTIPVGIDARSLQQKLASGEVMDWKSLIRERWGTQKIIVSRDKIDKLRGIKQKFLAYERFLRNNPEYCESTVLVQICIGSPSDSDYEAEIMQIVARINSLTENISNSQPVVMLHREIEFEQYLALLSEADAFIVSSMREGLNLTCHEFIVATSEKKSPLILSEFTGSSPLLECNGKGALLINPWDIMDFAQTIEKSLFMDFPEKSKRWKNCYDIVDKNDSKNWVSSCLASINESWEHYQKKYFTSLIPFTEAIFKDFYKKGSNGIRLFFINFETPSAISSVQDHKSISSSAVSVANKNMSFSEPSRLVSLLNELMSDPHNHVYIVSYLRRSDLSNLFSRTSNLGLVAENGGYIKLIGSDKWISLVVESELNSWMPQVHKLIDSKVERLPGSYCEVEDCTIRFHAGKSFEEDHDRSLDTMGECIQHINILFKGTLGVHATLIKNMVVVQQDHLCLKALKFIVSYYNRGIEGGSLESLIDDFQVLRLPSSLPSTPTKERFEEELNAPLTSIKHSHHISSFFISGGSSQIDEPEFEFANNLKATGEINEVLTVAVMGTEKNISTSANYGVSGKNELLLILSSVESE